MKVMYFSWPSATKQIFSIPFNANRSFWLLLHIGPLKICASISVVELFFRAYVSFFNWNSRCCYCARVCWTCPPCKEDLVCRERNREQLLGRFGGAADSTCGNYVHWQEWEQLAVERAYPEKLQGLNNKISVSFFDETGCLVSTLKLWPY